MADKGREDQGARDIYQLRRSAFRFFSGPAAKAWWTTDQNFGVEGNMPPEVRALPANKRPTAMAKFQRAQIARTCLFDLDEVATDIAVKVGAVIRNAAHRTAVIEAGTPYVVARMGVVPPTRAGFLRWASAVGYSVRGGAPITACHWSPHQKGDWITWWAKTDAVASTNSPQQRLAFEIFRGTTGPIFPEYSQLLSDRTEDACSQSGTDTGGIVTSDEVSDDIALIYTILGTWLLLADPDAVTLTQHGPSDDDARADRCAGMRESSLIHAAGKAVPEAIRILGTN